MVKSRIIRNFMWLKLLLFLNHNEQSNRHLKYLPFLPPFILSTRCLSKFSNGHSISKYKKNATMNAIAQSPIAVHD